MGVAAGDARVEKKTGDPKVTELAQQVCIKEDVTWLEVPMHHRVRSVLVKEDQRRANFRDDLDADMPNEWQGVVNTVESVFQASIW